MLKIYQVDRIDHPSLAIYASLRRSEEHRREGVFVVEGHRVLERLLDSDFQVISCLLPEKWLAHFRPLLEARAEEITVYIAPLEAMQQWTGITLYQGVLAVAQIPHRVQIETLLARPNRTRLFVAADGIQSAQNMGVLIRNSAGMGAQGMIVGETSCSPFVRLAVRASMGTIFKLPIVETDDLGAALGELRAAGVRCVAAHPAGGRAVWEIDCRSDLCVVLGNESAGVSSRTLDLCDTTAEIPMASGIDSLNVSNAAAIFLYEVNRQRNVATSP